MISLDDDGWMPFDGSTFSREDYPQLYAVYDEMLIKHFKSEIERIEKEYARARIMVSQVPPNYPG